MTLYGLNKPEAAIKEYQKVISSYPDDAIAPVCQLMIGRAFVKLGNAPQAKIGLQKVIDDYADFAPAKKQLSEACVELGDVYALESSYKEALSYYKKAYLACPPDDPDMMIRIMDKIYGGFKGLDISIARAKDALVPTLSNGYGSRRAAAIIS